MQLKTKIKVVIAEDEPAIMHSLAAKILEYDSDFLIVSQVSNGQDALEAIQHHRPDVLFTDIKMPVMDGIELIRTVNLQYPNIRIVILSGYSDFSYTQQAIRYGVLSYLLKPIESDALQETLQDLKNKIVREQYYETHKIIYSSNYSSGSGKTLEHCLLSVCVGNLFYDSSDPYLQNEYSQYRLSHWEPILSNILPHMEDWYISEEATNIFTICIRGTAFSCAAISECAMILQRRLLDHFPSVPVSIAYFQHPQKQEDVWMCTSRLQNLLQQRVVPAQSSVLILEKEEFFRPAESFSIVKTRVNNQLRGLISEKDAQGVRQELTLIFNYMVSHQVTQHDFYKVILYIMRTFEFNGLPTEDIYTKKVMRQLCTCFDKTKLVESLVSLIVQSFWQEDASLDLEEQLLSYINNHYLQLDQLEDLSEVFHYSYAYLSRLFKKRTGVSLNKYIIEKRLELSKRLIENNDDMSITQIAELSGFSDRRNFLRAFGAYVNMSPSEYKASIITKG